MFRGNTFNTVSVEIQNNGGKGYIYLDGLDFKLGTDDDEEDDGDMTTPEVSRQLTLCDKCLLTFSSNLMCLSTFSTHSSSGNIPNFYRRVSSK